MMNSYRANRSRTSTILLSLSMIVSLVVAAPALYAGDAGPGSPLEPDISPARAKLKTPTIVMYGYSDAMRDQWTQTLNTVNVVTGRTSDANLVTRLRAKGVVFAWHVVNTPASELPTADDLARVWSAPFRDTLGGKLPGGFDAIAIDELLPAKDGSAESTRVIAALREVRRLHPNRLIFAWGVWHLATGGGIGRYATKDTYDDLLHAARDSTDQFWLECYQREGNPQFSLFRDSAENVSRRAPGLLEKTLFALYISQSAPFIADDDKAADFFEFLDAQFHLLRNDPLLKKTSGVAFWAFYRSKPETIEHVNALVRHYFIKGQTNYYGSGRWK
jgi:hypothetical protein